MCRRKKGKGRRKRDDEINAVSWINNADRIPSLLMTLKMMIAEKLSKIATEEYKVFSLFEIHDGRNTRNSSYLITK